MVDPAAVVALPPPRRTGDASLEELLARRHSGRAYVEADVGLVALGQLLWAAQGTRNARGKRTAPSAGALYPLEVFVVAGRIAGLDPGIYHYESSGHQLRRVATGDRRVPLAKAALDKEWMYPAAAMIVFGAVLERTRRKYRKRAPRYVHIEVGHAAQNLWLQAEALGLATVLVGAFRDATVAEILELPDDVEALAFMPVGVPTPG